MTWTEKIIWHEIEEDGLPKDTGYYLVVSEYGKFGRMFFNENDGFYTEHNSMAPGLEISITRWSNLKGVRDE